MQKCRESHQLRALMLTYLAPESSQRFPMSLFVKENYREAQGVRRLRGSMKVPSERLNVNEKNCAFSLGPLTKKFWLNAPRILAASMMGQELGG